MESILRKLTLIDPFGGSERSGLRSWWWPEARRAKWTWTLRGLLARKCGWSGPCRWSSDQRSRSPRHPVGVNRGWPRGARSTNYHWRGPCGSEPAKTLARPIESLPTGLRFLAESISGTLHRLVGAVVSTVGAAPLAQLTRTVADILAYAIPPIADSAQNSPACASTTVHGSGILASKLYPAHAGHLFDAARIGQDVSDGLDQMIRDRANRIRRLGCAVQTGRKAHVTHNASTPRFAESFRVQENEGANDGASVAVAVTNRPYVHSDWSTGEIGHGFSNPSVPVAALACADPRTQQGGDPPRGRSLHKSRIRSTVRTAPVRTWESGLLELAQRLCLARASKPGLLGAGRRPEAPSNQGAKET